MENMLVFPAGSTLACQYAAAFLKKQGVALVDHPTPEVSHLLLDVPSFDSDGQLRNGGNPQNLLQMLPTNITVVGGNLNHSVLTGYRTLDLLKNPEYLAINAAITADCALQVAASHLHTTFSDSPSIVIGWGRIGKCLAALLHNAHSPVTIAARKETDRAMAKALGFHAVEICEIPKLLPQYRVLFNTVPELILRKNDFRVNGHCVKIELASINGIECEDIVVARGLPGVYAPESSGNLIGRIFLKLCREGNL